MTLAELVGASLAPGPAGALELTGVAADSRAVLPGNLFVALPYVDLPGFRFDGHDFVADAVGRGAVAVVATDPVRARAAAGDVPVLAAPDTRALLPRLAARWFGQPSRSLRLVGVTGTNGKTTTTFLLDAILRRAGWRTVLAGTVETRLAGEVRPATTTTPDPLSLQRMWREAVDLGVTGGAMEVSSHALDQHRVDGTCFEVAVFLNLTQDHLDYHGDMGTYAAAKARLFAADPETGHQPRAVIHGDDAYGRQLVRRGVKQPLVFGLGGEWDVRAEALRFDARGSSCRLITPAGSWDQSLRVVGDYNVANALAATATALALELPPDGIRQALAEAAGAPGRLEPVDEGQEFAVWVDYAHTPDALENVLAAARPLAKGKLITVFGCGGDRDRGKRPLMGRIAAERSDVALVTSDNPRTEDPDAILDDILAGIETAARARVLIEVDRRAAIGMAISQARPGDVVVIAGKGHEDYQILGDRKVHFDDREVAREWLRADG